MGKKSKSKNDYELFAAIGKKIVTMLISEGLISERIIRDMLIREDYKKLIESGVKSKEARRILTENSYMTSNGIKYFLGEKNIEKIIYSKKI
jgi:hypothetical protein